MKLEDIIKFNVIGSGYNGRRERASDEGGSTAMTAKKRGRKRPIACRKCQTAAKPNQDVEFLNHATILFFVDVRRGPPGEANGPTGAAGVARIRRFGRRTRRVQEVSSPPCPDNGIAFVLIPRLDPTHESLIVELITRRTSMPSSPAAEGIAIKANRVYVVRPTTNMTISAGMLRLTGPVERTGEDLDRSFCSLADDQREKDNCPHPLSRTRTTGRLGSRAVKAAGGMTWFRTPRRPITPDAEAHHHGLGRLYFACRTDAEAYVEPVQHGYVNEGRVLASSHESPDHVEPIAHSLRDPRTVRFRCHRKNARASAGTADRTGPAPKLAGIPRAPAQRPEESRNSLAISW